MVLSSNVPQAVRLSTNAFERQNSCDSDNGSKESVHVPVAILSRRTPLSTGPNARPVEKVNDWKLYSCA